MSQNYSLTAAKSLISLAAIGLFVSGSIQLSAHNNALVDYFYDSIRTKYRTEYIIVPNSTQNNNSANNNNTYFQNISEIPDGKYYADRTTTIFFDGWVCSNGNCTSFEDDVWVCDNMMREIAQARTTSSVCGILMLVGCFFTTLSLLSRGIGSMIYFCVLRTCSPAAKIQYYADVAEAIDDGNEKSDEIEVEEGDTSIEERSASQGTIQDESKQERNNVVLLEQQNKNDSNDPISTSTPSASASCCHQLGYKIQNALLYIGLIIMIVVFGVSIEVIYEGLDLITKPLCPDSGLNPYNVSFESSPDFSGYGRALHLIIASCGLTICINIMFFLWLTCFVCGRVCCYSRTKKQRTATDIDGENSENESASSSRSRASSLFGDDSDFYSAYYRHQREHPVLTENERKKTNESQIGQSGESQPTSATKKKTTTVVVVKKRRKKIKNNDDDDQAKDEDDHET